MLNAGPVKHFLKELGNQTPALSKFTDEISRSIVDLSWPLISGLFVEQSLRYDFTTVNLSKYLNCSLKYNSDDLLDSQIQLLNIQNESDIIVSKIKDMYESK